MQGSQEAKRSIAVFGATGHTGKFVVAELARRGFQPIAIARDANALESAAFPVDDLIRRQATIDDPISLDRALAGASAVINCAGPFADTAEPIAAAAIRGRLHYLDVCAEQISASNVLEKFDTPARQAGVVIVPAMAFYGGLSDLILSAIVDDSEQVDLVEILMGIDSWHPTKGTRNTIERNAVGNLVISEGQLKPAISPPALKQWKVPGPLGDQTVVEVPFSEAILIARHIQTRELHNYVPQIAVSEVLNINTPAPRPIDELGRSSQQFVIEVIAKLGSEIRRVITSGRDSYAVTAPLVCEAVQRILSKNPPPGAHSPGEIFNAREFLTALEPDHLTNEFSYSQ